MSSASAGRAVAGGEVEDLAPDPGRGVDAVGDRGDRHLGLVEGRPQPVEHLPADVAVQLRDAVGALAEAEAHHGHVEDRRVAAVVVLGAEGEDPLDRHARERAGRAEVLLDQLAREPVDAGRDRGVGGEDGGGAGHLERGVEVELRTALLEGQLADPLEALEPGVALVGVVDLGLRRTGDAGVGAQGADAADAEQDLLAEPVLGGAAVEAVGHVAVVVGVALDVGVEQQQRHATDLGDPDLGEQVGPVGLGDGDHGAVAVLLAEQRDGQLVGVEDGVLLELPALAGERLLEVAGVVEQADADERHAEVAGGLQVVTGQDAETAGVLRQHRGDAELRGEVGDPGRCLAARPCGSTTARRRGRRRGRPSPPRAGRGSPGRGTAPRAATGSPSPAGGPGRAWSPPTPRRPPRRRRPVSEGARTTSGCRRDLPGRRGPEAGPDGP